MIRIQANKMMIGFGALMIAYVGLWILNAISKEKENVREFDSDKNATRVSGNIRSELAELHRAVEAVNRKVEDVEMTQLSTNEDPNGDGEPEEEYEGGATSDEEEAKQYSEEESEKLFVEIATSTIEKQMEKEALDTSWQAKTLAEVERKIERSEIEGTSLSAVECTTTLCKVKFGHSDENGIDIDRLKQIMSSFGQEGFYHTDLPSKETTLYFPRDGYLLPELDLPGRVNR